MGARRIRREVRRSTVPWHGGLLGGILFGVGAPMFIGFFLIAMDTHPDLSDGHPRRAAANDASIPVGWPALRLESRERSDALPGNGAAVKMLGYMMDGYRFAARGSAVGMFVLMPSAGHFLHPAHRDPDEMVEVWPKARTVVFQERELVWVTGKFERLTSSGADHALYTLREASVAAASDRDIASWLVP